MIEVECVCLVYANYQGQIKSQSVNHLKYLYLSISQWLFIPQTIEVFWFLFFRFTFIMGTSIALAFRSLLRRGKSRKSLALKVIRRTVILFMLGLLVSNDGHNGKQSLPIFYCLEITNRNLKDQLAINKNHSES